MKTFSHLADVPVHYDRYSAESGFGYGTRGKPFNPRATVAMVRRLESCFAQLFAESPFGAGEVITSAGAYVGKPGYHGRGEAFDLDGVFWGNTQFVAIEYPAKPHLYLAIESIIRQHFGTVLGYLYNAAHRDHLHFDSSTPVGFQRMSKSRVEYLQGALLYVHGYQVGIDGVWGLETAEVTNAALNDLGLNTNIATRATWVAFLQATASRAFALAQ